MVITPCGGISYFAAFLRYRVPTIFIGYWDTNANAAGRMEEFLWGWVSRLNDMYYDVTKDEITIEAPGQPERGNYEDYRNYGATTITIPRMLRLTSAALYHSERLFQLSPGSFDRAHVHEFEAAM